MLQLGVHGPVLHEMLYFFLNILGCSDWHQGGGCAGTSFYFIHLERGEACVREVFASAVCPRASASLASSLSTSEEACACKV